MDDIPFIKMNSLGNDFVIIDDVQISSKFVRKISDRRTGIGFDQLAVIRSNSENDGKLEFFNADGSMSMTCGNATMCIAHHMHAIDGKLSFEFSANNGTVNAHVDEDTGYVTVNMGIPKMEWFNIPLSEEVNTLELPIDGNPCANGFGNPHCTFFVDDVNSINLEKFGRIHECSHLFPDRANVQIAEVTGPGTIKVRVWERGAGETPASGSSACAVTVAAIRKNLTNGDRHVTIQFKNGTMKTQWMPNGVHISGKVDYSFRGTLSGEISC